MKALILLAALIVADVQAGSSIEPDEYLGNWDSRHEITTGERTTLIIANDMSARLVRHLGGGENIVLEASPEDVSNIGELIIFNSEIAKAARLHLGWCWAVG